MKLLFITGSLPPIHCGVGYYSERLLGRLTSKVSVSLLQTSGTEMVAGAHHTHTVPDWKIRRLRLLKRYIRLSDPDVINIQYPAVGYRRNLGINLLPLYLRLSGIHTPVVVTLHEYHASPLKGRLRNLLTVLLATKIVVSNPYDKVSLPAWLSKKVVVIPIGSNIEKVATDKKLADKIFTECGLTPGRPTVAFFGFAFASKNLETLIDAMPGLPDLQLLLLSGLEPGDTYQAKLLARIATAKGRGARIGLAGFQEDAAVSACLQACDYFVLPAHEPLTAKSSTAIAALQHGLIVVGTAAADPALNLPFVNDDTAILLPTVSPESLQAALRRLSVDQSLRLKLVRGTTKLQHFFSWDTIVSRYIELCKELL